MSTAADQNFEERGSSPSWIRRLGISLAILLLVGAALALRAELLAETPSGIDASGALPVEVVTVEMLVGFESFERLAGRVVSRRRSDLGFERSGRVARIEVDAGDRVEKGALLAELDQRDLRAARRELSARLEATRSRLELARVTASRQQKLRDSNYLSPQALDEALANEASLEAELLAAGAALDRTRVSIELSKLVAPYDAIVVARNLDEGTVAGPGQTVLSVVEAGVQEVQLGVPPELASGLSIGETYRIENQSGESQANGDRFVREAKLVRLVPELDPMTRTQTAILELDATNEKTPRLADGSLVYVRISRKVPSRGAWLPVSALTEGRRGTWTAFALAENEAGELIVERRVVEIIQTEEARAYVRGTLETGDRVVTDGLHRLIPGVRVSVDAAAAQRTS
jgi:RND family efflux transporter MFP subunit